MTQNLLFDAAPEIVPALPGYPCVISPCRLYRYTCWRVWSNHTQPRCVMWLMLNPSKADADQLDNTLKRCVAFAKGWGFDGMCVCNLFAFRATDPADMLAARDCVVTDADYWIVQCADHCEVIVAAWSTMGNHQRRDEQVRILMQSMGKTLHVLSLNNDGSPTHPLFCPAAMKPIEWRRESIT